jgi:hypothetical protein
LPLRGFLDRRFVVFTFRSCFPVVFFADCSLLLQAEPDGEDAQAVKKKLWENEVCVSFSFVSSVHELGMTFLSRVLRSGVTLTRPMLQPCTSQP